MSIERVKNAKIANFSAAWAIVYIKKASRDQLGQVEAFYVNFSPSKPRTNPSQPRPAKNLEAMETKTDIRRVPHDDC